MFVGPRCSSRSLFVRAPQCRFELLLLLLPACALALGSSLDRRPFRLRRTCLGLVILPRAGERSLCPGNRLVAPFALFRLGCFLAAALGLLPFLFLVELQGRRPRGSLAGL